MAPVLDRSAHTFLTAPGSYCFPFSYFLILYTGISGQFFGQVFGQIFDQVFDQGFLAPKYSFAVSTGGRELITMSARNAFLFLTGICFNPLNPVAVCRVSFFARLLTSFLARVSWPDFWPGLNIYSF